MTSPKGNEMQSEVTPDVPRYRLRRIEDGSYVGFVLDADPNGELCRFSEVERSRWFSSCGSAALTAQQPAVVGDAVAGGEVVLDSYDAGLLSDHGGGNVEWWQDYIRAELTSAHDFYQSQIAALPAPPAAPQPASNPDELPAAVAPNFPERYGCNGPQGTFWTDDVELANKLIAATFDRDDWTVTDMTQLAGRWLARRRDRG